MAVGDHTDAAGSPYQYPVPAAKRGDRLPAVPAGTPPRKWVPERDPSREGPPNREGWRLGTLQMRLGTLITYRKRTDIERARAGPQPPSTAVGDPSEGC